MAYEYESTVEVRTEWLKDTMHAMRSLAQFCLNEGGSIERDEELIKEGCRYLRTAETKAVTGE